MASTSTPAMTHPVSGARWIAGRVRSAVRPGAATSAAPIAAPRYGLPPKRPAAENPRRTGSNANTAAPSSPTRATGPRSQVTMSTRAASPNTPGPARTLWRAVRRPPATKAGSSGVNTSTRRPTARAGSRPGSAGVGADPALRRTAAVTASTLPGPTTICTRSPTTCAARTPGIRASDATSTRAASAGSTRTRVAQCVTSRTFPAPPRASRIASAIVMASIGTRTPRTLPRGGDVQATRSAGKTNGAPHRGTPFGRRERQPIGRGSAAGEMS